MCNVTKVNAKVDVNFGSSFQDQYIKIISIKLDPKFTSALAFDFGYITKPPLNLDFTSIQVYLYRRG